MIVTMENVKSIEVTGPYKKVNAATKAAIDAKDTSKQAFDEAFDRAVEFGWEMGVVERQVEVLDLIDALKEKLTPEEKDAHMVLDIVYRGVVGLAQANESESINE
jgi:hypothetical protein